MRGLQPSQNVAIFGCIRHLKHCNEQLFDLAATNIWLYMNTFRILE